MRSSSDALADADPPFTLSGTIEPTRLSVMYRAGLVVVAIGMLLLPFLYLLVIVGAAAMVWWHLTANTWLLSGPGGGQWRLIAYLGPVIIGAILVFFMVKPVLARPARRTEPVWTRLRVGKFRPGHQTRWLPCQAVLEVTIDGSSGLP